MLASVKDIDMSFGIHRNPAGSTKCLSGGIWKKLEIAW